jgi:PIN domain nuclease of toxin-antitoxin system
MTLLLDSHTLLWAIYAPHKLAPAARQALEDGTNAVFFSVVSLWELAIKCSKGSLEIDDGFIEEVGAANFVELSIRPVHAWGVKSLPPLHGDPFDRLLVTQATQERMTLVTRDQFLAAYGINILTA